MKKAIFGILKREAPFFRERVVLSSHKTLLFRQETHYDPRTGILTSNEHSGFGSSLLSLLGPLLLLTNSKVIPARIETQSGFRNYCDAISREPLAALFERHGSGNQKSEHTSFGEFVYYPNNTGNFAELTLPKLLTDVLCTYFSPKREIVEVADQFFADNGLEAAKCLSVFIRGTDGPTQDVSQVCSFARRLYHERKLECIILHSSDSSVAVIAATLLRDLPVVLCDLLPLKPSSSSTFDPHPKISPSDCGRLSLATLLVIAKSGFVVLGQGYFSVWSVLLRGNCQGVFKFNIEGRLENPLYVRLFYWLVKISRPELVSL